ncbi:hypothetical protein BGZ81_006939 [Podila clonocystis]|nr:hypothetical protein BGZ81_006939 [Podila clonocystis]
MNTNSANRKYQAAHPWDSKAPRESSGNHTGNSSQAKDPAAAPQSASLGDQKTQTSKAPGQSSSAAYSCENSNYVNHHGYQQYNPRHESTSSSSSSSLHSPISHTSQCVKYVSTIRKRKKTLSTCTTATSILFLLAVADLVASTSIELSSPKSLLTASTRAIPSEQYKCINNHIILPSALGSDSTIVELAQEASHSTPNMRAEFGKRQVAPWPTASRPPPGDPSISDTTNFLASTTSSNPSPPSSLTTATPSSSPHPAIPSPDLPRPAVKPYLLTDFEYETMWNPDYRTMRLGVLLPFNAKATSRESLVVRKAMSAIRLAVNDANQQRLIPGLNLTIVVRDSQDPSLIVSNGGAAAISAAGSLLSVKVSGVIGDIRSDITRYEALITSSVQIPQCSFGSANTILSDSSMYPYFFRTIPTTIVLLDAILDVIRSAGWKRISLIYDIDTMGWAGREYFSSKANKMGIFILAYQPLTTAGVPYDATFEFVANRIHASQSRIQVLIATGTIQENCLEAMKNAGLFGPDYAWVTMNDIADQLRLQEGVKEFDGLIMVDNGWELNGYEPFEKFLSDWMTLNPHDYPGAVDPELDNNEGMAYSCVMMLAHAYGRLVNDTIPADEHSERREVLLQGLIDGEHTEEIIMQNYFGNTTYRGPSGPITLDHNGDRKEGGGGATVQNPRWNTTSGIIFTILCLIGFMMTFTAAILVLYFRNHIVIKASSPTFCICELVGIFLVLLWCILHIGIPTESTCAAQSFILPIGTTLLAGSLTIKNYRIYRIFNSVTVANQSFQTRKLLWYLAAIVLLATIPIIVEIFVDPPVPKLINIRSYQWVHCRGIRTSIWWQVAAAIFPTLLMLFGVFLAFKTRNVVFLWNEARQISLVLYNVLFFTIIVAIAQAFPPEIYLATFYITIIGTYFIAMLALIVLFTPKFWHVYKSRHKWAGDHYASPQGRIGTMGGGGGGGIDTAAVLSRLPGDMGGRHAATTTLAVSDLEVTGMDDGAGVLEGVSNQITAEEVHSPSIGGGSHAALQRIFSTDSAGSRRSRRSAKKMEANPLGAWTKAKVPHKGTVPMAGIFGETFPELHDDEEHAPQHRKRSTTDSKGTRKTLDGKPQRRVDFDLEANTKGAREGDEHGTVDAEPLRTQLVRDRTFSTSNSGAQRVLDCYVFLLPIRVHKSRISNILSHWAMATLILIPEAHAFMAVDSTDGKASSYLMLTMVQLRSETEPTLRVTTCHSGMLLIRFSTQERLDGWMSLFSEEDLQDLSGRSDSTSSAGHSVPMLPSFAHAGSGRLGMLGPGMSLSSEMNELQRQFHQQQEFGHDVQQLPSHRSGSSQDLLASDGGVAQASMMPGPDQEQRLESSHKRQSWTSRLKLLNAIGRFWNRKDSSNSTSGDIDEDLSPGNAARIRAGGEGMSTDCQMTMTTAVPIETRKNHVLKENVLEDDREDDDAEALEPSTKLVKESIIEGKDVALPESPVSASHGDLPSSSVTPDAPDGSHGESDITLNNDTPTLQKDEVAPPTAALAPGDTPIISTPVSKTEVITEASSTGTPIASTHPDSIACLARSLTSSQPSSTPVTTQQNMIVRSLPPDDESGDAFYEDAVLADTDEPVKPKITDMDLHPSREFCNHAKYPHGMTAVLSLPQIDFSRTRNRSQASMVQDPKQQPSAIPGQAQQKQGQKRNPAAEPKPPRQAKFPIVPQLEPRPISPALERSLHPTSQADNLDMGDDSEDDLYDPEFGIGPASGRRRRRSRFVLPANSNSPVPSTNAAIPSADVISAAAKAVSQGWSESEALKMAMMNHSPQPNTNSLTQDSGGLSLSPSRKSRTQQQTDPRRSPMASVPRSVSRQVGISDADLGINRSSSFRNLTRSELPLLSPPTNGSGGAVSEERRSPTPQPKLGKRAARLMASNRATISGPTATLAQRRDSDTGQVLAPAIAAPTVSSSESQVDGGLDDALVAPLAVYATEDQHT